MTNLLINAAQYSYEGHDITLEATGLEDSITIRVSHFGQVIPEESLKTIFQPLAQLEQDIEEDDRLKTSLGLAFSSFKKPLLLTTGSLQ